MRVCAPTSAYVDVHTSMFAYVRPSGTLFRLIKDGNDWKTPEQSVRDEKIVVRFRKFLTTLGLFFSISDEHHYLDGG